MRKETKIILSLFIILVFSVVRYLKFAYFPRKQPSNQYNVIKRFTPTSTISPTIKSYPTPVLNQSKTRAVYRDENILFEYPMHWNFDTSSMNSPFIRDVHFMSECNKGRIIAFTYKSTDIHDVESMKLGQRNPNGPIEQISEKIIINGIVMGKNTQGNGDGSGGYEPGVTVDFLTQSKNFHYYFKAVLGCRNSLDESYELDLLPILKTLRLLK